MKLRQQIELLLDQLYDQVNCADPDVDLVTETVTKLRKLWTMLDDEGRDLVHAASHLLE